MERPPVKPLLVTRSLAVVSAVFLATAYIIFAQVNAAKERSAPLLVPSVPVEDAMHLRYSQVGAPRDLSSEAIGSILQTSSKSGVLVHEATAIVTGDLMSFGPVSLNKSTPAPAARPDYLGSSSKMTVLRREAEAVISVAGLKLLSPTPATTPVPQLANAPSTGVTPLILPVATPLPAAR